MFRWKKSLVVASLGLALVQSGRAHADGETTYDPAYCGGPHGTPPPTFSTLIDLPILFAKIAEYTLFPGKLYGPGPWTNWYLEPDLRVQLAKLASLRSIVEKHNLWDTYIGAYPIVSACTTSSATNRTIDGTCNDPKLPFMGSAGVRFGRNMDPTSKAAQAETTTLMSPSPREVSRVLFTRDRFKPVPFLNMYAAAWIPFNVHDWFAHTNSARQFHEVPLAAGDPLRTRTRSKMLVAKTAADATRTAAETAMGPTFKNAVTHWWDASQVYGSDLATSNRLRTFERGHLKIDPSGLLPVAGDGFEDTGFRQNWWVGLALLHNLFAREHNAIADKLHAAYPQLTDQQLFDKARMVTAAVIAKIHTVEWTPAILPHRALEIGMNANWYGLNKYLSPKLLTLPSYVPLPYRHVIFGVRRGPRELHKNEKTGKEVPFALTEEFVSVYRMHPLLPDGVEIYNFATGQLEDTVPLEDTRDADARALVERYGEMDLLYSFGITHPGGLVLNNYPGALMNLQIPVVGPLDLGTVDILRDRERGVPRYNEFRRQLNLKPLASIDELTDDLTLRTKLKSVYGADGIEKVDLLVGTMAEAQRPDCYGFGETLFQVFLVMATRRLHGDRFYTELYTPEVYTQVGLDWIEQASMKKVLLRHHPELADSGLAGVSNAFYPWE